VNVIRHLTALRSKGYSVRAYVMTIVAIVLMPSLLFGGSLVYSSAHSQREQTERIADREAREVTATIDREMINAKSILRSLVDSYYVWSGDLVALLVQPGLSALTDGLNAMVRIVEDWASGSAAKIAS